MPSFTQQKGDRILLELTISGTRGRNGMMQETIYGLFISYNSIDEENTAESITINRVLNIAEVLRFNEDPVLHRQTLVLRNYNVIGQSSW